MKRYEYKCLPYRDARTNEAYLNEMGSEGWLLLGEYSCLVFAREIPDGLAEPVAEGSGHSLGRGAQREEWRSLYQAEVCERYAKNLMRKTDREQNG